MKTIFKKIFITGISILVFCSCEKDEDKIVVKSETPPVLTSSVSTVVLSKADADKDAIVMTWTAAEYGFEAGVKYSLQFDKKGNNFAKAKTILFDTIHKTIYKVRDLNWIALGIGLPKGIASEMEVRVKAGVSANVDSLSSNTTIITVTPYIDAPVLTGSANTIALIKAKGDDDAVTFTATPADFGPKDAEIKYFLEFGKKGNNFSVAKRVEFPSTLTLKYLVKEINQIATKDLGMSIATTADVEVRLKASVSSKIDSASSNTLTYSVTPYLAEELTEYQTLYMLGDATEFGNDTLKAIPMFRTPTSKFLFTYTGYFKVGGLKFITAKASIPMWGSSGGLDVARRLKKDDAVPAAFSILEAGYHTVTLDIEKLKFTITNYVPTVPAAYGDMKMNGDFNGWGAGIPMTNSTTNPHIWSLDYTFNAAYSMKFQTGNWSSQFAPTKDWSSLFGVLDGTNDNLYILTGSYTILFNDLTKEYLYIKK